MQKDKKMITMKQALAASALTLALGLGGSIANAATVKQGPFACPVDTSITAGKLAATCNTYGFYNPEDNPQTDTLAKVQGLYPVITAFYDKDEGGSDNGPGDGNFFLTDGAFGAIDYGSTSSGYFMIADSLLSSYATFVLTLKGGNADPSWVAFEFSAANLLAGMGNFTGFSYGSWSSGRQGLSHASLYVGGEPTGDDDDDDDTDLPEPGSLALLGLGLLGLGISRRRRAQ
jgi:hypothetical protein